MITSLPLLNPSSVWPHRYILYSTTMSLYLGESVFCDHSTTQNIVLSNFDNSLSKQTFPRFHLLYRHTDVSDISSHTSFVVVMKVIQTKSSSIDSLMQPENAINPCVQWAYLRFFSPMFCRLRNNYEDYKDQMTQRLVFSVVSACYI